MNRGAYLGLAALLGTILAGCAPASYPLAIHANKLFLETHDRTGAERLILVDTGSDRSFVLESWAKTAGGYPVAGPPFVWIGINLEAEGHHRVAALPDLPGVPPVLNGLASVEDSSRSPLSDPTHEVALLGLDVLWEWSIDFSENPPRLVKGSVTPPAEPGTIRWSLQPSGGHEALWVGFHPSGDALRTWSLLATVDTGSPWAWAISGTAPLGLPAGGLSNPKNANELNGLPSDYRSVDFTVESLPAPGQSTLTSAEGPTMVLIGTPALAWARAVLDLPGGVITIRRPPAPRRCRRG